MSKRKRCYLCEQRVPKKAFKKLGHTITKCPSCQLYALKFEADYDSFIEEYYNEEFFTGSQNRAGYVDYLGDDWPERQNMNRYLSRIKHYKTGGKLLDCGCATGLFLQVAKKAGFEVKGFDVSDYAVEKAVSILGDGVVSKATMSSAKFPRGSFDVITLFDVIEHLEDPRQDLSRVATWLAKDGIIMINTGDVSSVLARLEGKKWHFFVPPQHLFYFSRKTITMLLSQAGLEVFRIDYKGKWVSVRYLLHLYRQIYQTKLGGLLYKLIGTTPLGRIPLYLNLFDNMVVYARKSTRR